MKKLKILIFILVGVSLISGPFVNRIAVAYSPEYKWTDANNIDAQDNDNPNNPNSNQTYTFTSKTGKEYKYTINNGGCSHITVQAKSGDAKLYTEKLVGQDCVTGKYNSSDISIKGDLPTAIKKNQDLDPANNNAVDCNAKPDDERCKDQQPADNPCWLSVGAFGWILCPILDFANTLYNWMFGIVRNLLFIPEASYSSNSGLKESWNNMKNIASAIIVLVALVMIAAQIFNFEFISAYTVKKALPRLVIAAIAIQLSWFIFTLLIQITNGVGAGIYNLLTLPFDNAGDILTDLTNQTDSVGYGSQTFAGLLIFLGISSAAISGLITALTPGGWMTLVLVSIGVIVSMLVALITLIVRKMLIITLLILSPVALALWILPGTQKVWSMWWQLFSKLLLMFPLIMILFAAGQIFAASLSNIDESGVVGSVNMIMIIVAFFAPLFLIPGTFKAAGGIFGQIAGFISGSGKKISDGGFGLRRKRDAYRKVSDEMKANELQRKARAIGTSALNPNASRLQKIRGRAQLGVSGFLPGGSDKLSRQVARYGGETERDELNEAKLEFNSRTRDFTSFKDKANAAAAIAGATGDTATYTRADGQQETIQVNDALRRTAGQFLAEGGEVDQVRAVVEDLKHSGRGAVAAKITEDSVGTLIKTAPDLYNKDVDALGHIDLGSVKPGTLRNYAAQLGAWQRQAETYEQQGNFSERDAIRDRITSVSEQADRALNDTNLNISSEMMRTLTAMRDVDLNSIDSITSSKDFAGRDTTVQGSGASSKQFLGKPDPTK